MQMKEEKEQKKLELEKADKNHTEKKEEEKENKMPENRIIIGNAPMKDYVWSVIEYMLGDNYDDEKGIDIQWDNTHENKAKQFMETYMKRMGCKPNGSKQEIKFGYIKTIGNREVVKTAFNFVQNFKQIPAVR